MTAIGRAADRPATTEADGGRAEGRSPSSRRERALQRFASAAGYVPITERVLAGTRLGPWLVGIVATLPFVHLVGYWALLRSTGLTADGPESLASGVPMRLLNVYLIVLTFWAAGRISRQLRAVRVTLATSDDRPGTWTTWLLPPLLLDLVLGTANELGHLSAFRPEAAAAAPGPFAFSFAVGFLIRIPTLTAFWTAVIALLEVARLGRDGRLATFPEDRSLGFQGVGELVFELFGLLGAGFLPVLLLSGGFGDLALNGALLGGSMAVMVLAIWRLHHRMTAARDDAITEARARYAQAYRGAAQAPTDSTAGTALSTAEALLRGAESIHEWPFDERTQRLVAIVLTGVVTSLIVRLILYAFGI